MALVRKTATLKEEISNRLSEIVVEKIESLYKKHSGDVLITAMFNALLTNGRIFDNQCLEHFARVREFDPNNLLDISADMKQGKALFGFCNEKGGFSRMLGDVDVRVTTNRMKYPQVKKKQALMGFSADKIHFIVGHGEYSNPGMQVAFNFTVDEMPGLQTVNSITSMNSSFNNSGTYPLIHVEQFLPDEQKALGDLELFRTKVEGSVRRMEAVRVYVLKTLWPVCSSLNGMAKHFPGILEYVKDDTLKRFHKNAPRNATLDPSLMPDANVLAATAEVKLKR